MSVRTWLIERELAGTLEVVPSNHGQVELPHVAPDDDESPCPRCAHGLQFHSDDDGGCWRCPSCWFTEIDYYEPRGG